MPYVMTRNAMEICMFGVLSVSTFSAAALGDLPVSLQLAPSFGRVAAIALWVGSIGCLVGIFIPNRDRGLLVEQFALVPAAFGAIFWAAAVYFTSWRSILVNHPWWRKTYLSLSSSQIALGLSLGLAASCIVRWLQIQSYVKARERLPEPGGK